MIGDLPAVVTSSKTGETVVAPSRFKNAGEVREVCNAMIQADRPRSSERAEVDKQANGNPCYSLAALRAKKQGWRARTNYRGLEGKLSELENVFYDLNADVDPAVRVFLDYGDGDEREQWQECIAKNYTRMLLQQWSGFDTHVPLRNSQMLRHGLGAHVWLKKGKWEPSTPVAGELLFPENTPIDFYGKGEMFMLRQFTPAHELYSFIRNEETARTAKWNVDEVWKVLANASKSRGSETPEDYQRSMRNSDYGTSARTAGVYIDYLYVIELETRKIAQYAVAEKDEGSGKFLLERRNYFDSFEDVISLFPYDVPSTGTLHGIRGFGARAREHYDLLNRIYNAMADNTLISMYPQFKQTGATDPDKLKLMRIGAMTIYPQNVEPQTLGLPNLAQGAIPLSQILNGSINENNQTYLAGVPEAKDRETALSYQMRAQDSGRVSKATHSLYHRNITRTHKKQLLTALRPIGGEGEEWGRLAREFKKRCLTDGVPEAALGRITDIEAMRSVGAGSTAAKFQNMLSLMTYVYPNTTEDRKIAIERDLTSALVGYSQVDRYARGFNDNAMPDNDESFAALENDALARGDEAVISGTQNHVTHANSHLQKAGEIVQAVQQGAMDPREALAAIQAIGRHTAVHLKQLEGNPARKAEFDRLNQELMALASITAQLQQQVEEQDEAASQEQQVSDDLRVGMAKVEADHQVKTVKMQRDEARKDAKFVSDTRLKFGTAAAQARLNSAKAVADVRTKRLTAGTRKAA